jgi:hypothetical protein
MPDLYFTTNHGPEAGDTWRYSGEAEPQFRVVVRIDDQNRVWCTDPYDYRTPTERFIPLQMFRRDWERI